jgi:hypothetical protein
MVQFVRQLTPDTVSKCVERRSEVRIRTAAIRARLSDLYRERVPVVVLNISPSGLGLKVDERFTIDFPVLVECEGLIIMANVRHCIPSVRGGYVLGLRIQKILELVNMDTPNNIPKTQEPPSSEEGSGGSGVPFLRRVMNELPVPEHLACLFAFSSSGEGNPGRFGVRTQPGTAMRGTAFGSFSWI